ncbi:MAG: DNA polymerase IV [Gemmatimonadaceae bacterium]|nr:DNA polymerase IV [Gemmatimonadaceae bacterium]NUS95928.1 DNA polymerase IV [Gemmatimonadaceae bacterium]
MAATAPLRHRSILLADCDVYYVQLARMADPDGAGRARLLIVGGSAESRGVVCSATYEVRKFGVRSGMPISRAVKLCPQAMCVPVPRELTARKSEEIVEVLHRFAPDVESASPDEAYMDLTTTMDTVYRGRTLADVARVVRAAVERETGIRVSMGGGTNKLVAKLAVEPAKPRDGSGGDGVYVVAPGEEAAFVARLKLAEIPGIGPKFQEQLARRGWFEVRDVVAVPREELERALGERTAAWLHDVAHGIDDSPVHQREEPKSMGREETFARDIMSDAELERELLQLVDRVTSDLREEGYAARTVTVKLKDSDFTLRSAARTLDEAITTYHAMAPVAKELLKQLRKKRRVAARLIGVSASHLVRGAVEGQLALFADERAARETAKQRELAAALDSVREKFGRKAMRIGKVD